MCLDKELVDAAGISVEEDAVSHLIPADVVVEVLLAFLMALLGSLLHTEQFIPYSGIENTMKQYDELLSVYHESFFTICLL